MANYFYVALDREGKKITGTVEGTDLKKIKKDLRQQGFYVVKIQESNSSLPFFSKKIKEDKVVVFPLPVGPVKRIIPWSYFIKLLNFS